MHIKSFSQFHFTIFAYLLGNIVNSNSTPIEKLDNDFAKYFQGLDINWSPDLSDNSELRRELDESNPWEEGTNFEGDIKLEPGELETRGGSTGLIWPRGYVPFRFVSRQWQELTDKQRSEFTYALTNIYEKTCVRLAYCGVGAPSDCPANYIGIVTPGNDPNECSSRVGIIPEPGVQYMNLAEKCYTRKTLIHEFIHALGFYHEQSRTDRDDFVFIHTENIKPDLLFNFQKYNTESFTKYDPYSIMHYKKRAFSKNGGDTITFKSDPSVSDYFGTGDGYGQMSDDDIRDINHKYDCCKYGTVLC